MSLCTRGVPSDSNYRLGQPSNANATYTPSLATRKGEDTPKQGISPRLALTKSRVWRLYPGQALFPPSQFSCINLRVIKYPTARHVTLGAHYAPTIAIHPNVRLGNFRSTFRPPFTPKPCHIARFHCLTVSESFDVL